MYFEAFLDIHSFTTFLIAVEEWEKKNNITLYTNELYILELSINKGKGREREIQVKLAKELNAKMEVETPVGRIDLLNKDSIIEIKRFSQWKDALGQILSYGMFYPLKKKVIYLFGDKNVNINIDDIKKIYSKYDIELILI